MITSVEKIRCASLRRSLISVTCRKRVSGALQPAARGGDARNLEVIWLLHGLRPDFKAIADFRKDNRHAFKPVFRQFVLLCRKLDLFGRELLAVDGTRLKAVNSTDRNFTREKLVTMIRSADERLADYLSRLDRTDAEEDGASGRAAKNLIEKIAALKERKTRHEGMLKELERTGQSQISLTGPDSRAMASYPKVGVGYNAHVAFDAKHKLIVEQRVTNAGSDLCCWRQPPVLPRRCSASSGSTLSPTGATTRARTSRRARTRVSRPTSPGRSAGQRYVTVCFARRSSATTRPATPIAAPADSSSIRSTVAARETTRRCSTAIAMHAWAVSSSRIPRPISIGGLADGPKRQCSSAWRHGWRPDRDSEAAARNRRAPVRQHQAMDEPGHVSPAWTGEGTRNS